MTTHTRRLNLLDEETAMAGVTRITDWKPQPQDYDLCQSAESRATLEGVGECRVMTNYAYATVRYPEFDDVVYLQYRWDGFNWELLCTGLRTEVLRL